MPDLIRHPEAGKPGAWIPAFAGMTGSYTASLFALGDKRIVFSVSTDPEPGDIA